VIFFFFFHPPDLYWSLSLRMSKIFSQSRIIFNHFELFRQIFFTSNQITAFKKRRVSLLIKMIRGETDLNHPWVYTNAECYIILNILLNSANIKNGGLIRVRVFNAPFHNMSVIYIHVTDKQWYKRKNIHCCI
jgi:hypothetical protein